MSGRFPSRDAVLDKVLNEGSIVDALQWGITANDMPPGDTELTAAWTALDEAYKPFAKAAEAIEKLLDDGAYAR